MKVLVYALGTFMVVSGAGVLEGQTDDTALVSSSSSATISLPDAPEMASVFGRGKDRGGVRIEYQSHLRRFSHWAMAVKVGAGGIGIDVATPLSNKWNLRVGADYLGGSYHFNTSDTGSTASFGATVEAGAIGVDFKPHFRSAFLSADWYPWFGSFRVSPGLTIYNGDRATILATVAGGQSIDVGNGSYSSDPADPIVATLVTRLGRKVAPQLTIGWGNMIPRTGKHFSFPFEFGIEYVGRPQLVLTLSGSECDPNGGGCYPLTVDASTQANITQEQHDLNNDIAPLRFYPVLSTGVSYRF